MEEGLIVVVTVLWHTAALLLLNGCRGRAAAWQRYEPRMALARPGGGRANRAGRQLWPAVLPSVLAGTYRTWVFRGQTRLIR